jgi:hypothetical protein
VWVDTDVSEVRAVSIVGDREFTSKWILESFGGRPTLLRTEL